MAQCIRHVMLVNGRAKAAQVYPVPALVAAILKGFPGTNECPSNKMHAQYVIGFLRGGCPRGGVTGEP